MGSNSLDTDIKIFPGRYVRLFFPRDLFYYFGTRRRESCVSTFPGLGDTQDCTTTGSGGRRCGRHDLLFLLLTTCSCPLWKVHIPPAFFLHSGVATLPPLDSGTDGTACGESYGSPSPCTPVYRGDTYGSYCSFVWSVPVSTSTPVAPSFRPLVYPV